MFIPVIVLAVAGVVGVLLLAGVIMLWVDNQILEDRISKLNCDVVLLRENKHILEDKLSKFKCDVAISQEANSPKG